MGKPQTLKQVNLSLVRQSLRERGSATRGELVEATKISGTTVRTLLQELMEAGELQEVGCDASIGGRKAVRYALRKDRFFGVALCLVGRAVRYLVVDICGTVQESGTFPGGEDVTQALCAFLDRLMERREIRSIGLGVPGVVSGMAYRRINRDGILERCPVGEVVAQRYGVPVLLENDLNAITLGFGRCYLSQYPEEDCEDLHMAYLHFEKDCLSAGFLSNGRVLRGWKNFAGELGLFPVGEEGTLDDVLALPMEEERYARLVARLAAAVCCVLNPKYVTLGGSAFRRECLPLITEHFNGLLPDQMSAELLDGGDTWQDYAEGMAYLTAEQIFADVKLVQGTR